MKTPLLTIPQRSVLSRALILWIGLRVPRVVRLDQVVVVVAGRVGGTGPISEHDLAVVLAFAPIALVLSMGDKDEALLRRAYKALGYGTKCGQLPGEGDEDEAEEEVLRLLLPPAPTLSPPPTTPRRSGPPDLDFGTPGERIWARNAETWEEASDSALRRSGDRITIPARLDGPFELSGYNSMTLVQSHVAEMPDGTTLSLPPGTKLHRIGDGTSMTVQTGQVDGSGGSLPTVSLDA